MLRTTAIPKTILLLVAGLVLTILLVGASTIVVATGPGRQVREFGLPLGGGHRLMAMLIPCTATQPGRLIIGRDLFLSSRFPPPGLVVPAARPCP